MPSRSQSSTPAASDVAAWLAEHYRFAGAIDCECFRPGWPSLYRVEADRELWWLRMYAAERPTLAVLEAQVEALRGWLSAGCAVVVPVERRDGAFVGELHAADGMRPVVLFGNVAGRVIEASALDDWRAFGAAVAGLHVASTGMMPAASLPRIDDEIVSARALTQLSRWPASAEVLDEVRGIVETMIDIVGASDLPGGICHGDLHVDNARRNADEVTLFDFDQCCAGPFAYDVACVWRKCLLASADSGDDAAAWITFRRSYESLRPLAPHETTVIPAYATLRAAWTMAMPTRFADIFGTAWLRDPSYFEAHLAMMRRLCGASLG